MNLKDYPRQAYSINQFTQPQCYELEGENFVFIMDNGYDYQLRIIDKDTCEWNILGQPPKQERYKCLKGDDTTYIFTHDVESAELSTGITYVIDLEQQLVTILTCHTGENPKYPLLVTSHYDFGGIRNESTLEVPFKRHSFTDDMLGTTVEWHWRSDMWTQHAYNSTTYYRINLPKESGAFKTLENTIRYTPSSDEPARYVKIKEKMYLFVLTEAHSEKMAGDKGKHRSNNMAFLQNYDRMFHVGRTFGNNMVDGEVVPTRIVFGAFGKPLVLPSEFLDAPNPYIV